MSRFSLRPAGRSYVAELDGVDISKVVHTVTITAVADPAEPSRVELGITVFEVEGETAEDARIVLAPGTDDLLKRLGWTPPVEDA